MARYFLQFARPLVRVARTNIEIFATLAAIAAGALVPLPSPSQRGGSQRGSSNVRLTVALPLATDSLAFSLMR